MRRREALASHKQVIRVVRKCNSAIITWTYEKTIIYIYLTFKFLLFPFASDSLRFVMDHFKFSVTKNKSKKNMDQIDGPEWYIHWRMSCDNGKFWKTCINYAEWHEELIFKLKQNGISGDLQHILSDFLMIHFYFQ